MGMRDIRLLDVRWLLYRALCRLQYGESQPRWVAVAFMGTFEWGWATLVQFSVCEHIGCSAKEMPPLWWFLLIYCVLYFANWFLIVPAKGAIDFEQRFLRWPTWAQELATPFAVASVVALVLLFALKVWTWF
jgi:hypothetical protein